MAEHKNVRRPAEAATYNKMQMNGRADVVIQARDIYGPITFHSHQPKTSEPTDPLKLAVDGLTPRQRAAFSRMLKFKLPGLS
jgi:hypothetical protein